jgi:hypothetical protein
MQPEALTIEEPVGRLVALHDKTVSQRRTVLGQVIFNMLVKLSCLSLPFPLYTF